jgi:hypothetical protein
MASFKYYSIPTGYNSKSIKLNRLSNYQLTRIVNNEWYKHEYENIRAQAKLILMKRKKEL